MINGQRFRMARDLFAVFPLAAADMTSAPSGQTSLEFCRSLVLGKIPEEAVTFCAYLLPGRSAIWWGQECLAQVKDLLGEDDVQVLTLIRNWIGAPMEHRYRQALYNLSTVQQRTPATWIAFAAGMDVERNGVQAGGVAEAPAAARAINTGILAGLARVATADRRSVIHTFAEMAIQLAELEEPAVSAKYF